MSKKKGILFFIISIIVILLCCFTSAFGFGRGAVGSAKNITLGLDLRGGVSITYEVQDKEFSQTDMDDTIYKLQLRVAEYSADASVYQEGTDRITVEIPGVYDTQTVIEELGRPGSLQFITYDAKNEDGTTDFTQPTVWVTGSDVVNAQAGTQSDQKTGSSDFVVQLQLGDEGAEKFAEATTSHVGDIIYIVYDGEVVSYPRVQSAITGGNCVIEGMGSYEAASTLASTIRIGSLNLELEEISSKVVSAKLG
ncbi:MAG: protein translocase subunit SecDF, partial [Lachnospiraceae bacterium]|nr:protein translocase subunit SecDF [Lachnospiraceae bacterium]